MTLKESKKEIGLNECVPFEEFAFQEVNPHTYKYENARLDGEYFFLAYFEIVDAKPTDWYFQFLGVRFLAVCKRVKYLERLHSEHRNEVVTIADDWASPFRRLGIKYYQTGWGIPVKNLSLI